MVWLVSSRAFHLLCVVRLITNHVLLINSERHETPPAIITYKSAASWIVPRRPFCSSPSAGMCKQNPVWNRDGSAVHHRRALWGQYCKPNTLSAGGVRGGCGAGCSTCMLTPVCMRAHSVSLGWCHIYVPHNIPSGWHAQKKQLKQQ